MTIISTDEAESLMDKGVPYIDVRSVPEFEEGHVPGALNVPLAMAGAGGMVPNAHFVEVMSACFANDQKLIIACKAGGRSARAVAELKNAGFTQLFDMTGGFVAGKDPFGQVIPGWSAEGREVETTAEETQTYAYLKSEAGV